MMALSLPTLLPPELSVSRQYLPNPGVHQASHDRWRHEYAMYTKGDRGLMSLVELVSNGMKPKLVVVETDHEPTTAFCMRNDIEMVVSSRPRTDDHARMMHRLGIDLLVCNAYSKILPAELLESVALGGVNCHSGRLPEYRGASPIPWQILNGEKFGELNVLRMTAGIDDGPVLAKHSYLISADDDAASVMDTVTRLTCVALPTVVARLLAGGVVSGVIQDESRACRWTRRVPSDSRIDWTQSAERIVNLVRAMAGPYPAAFTYFGEMKYEVHLARVYDQRVAGIAGRCVGKNDGAAIVVAGSGAVELLVCSSAGRMLFGSDLPLRYGSDLR